MSENVTIYQRPGDEVWPWGYFIRGVGNFVTDSKADAERNTTHQSVKKLRDQIRSE